VPGPGHSLHLRLLGLGIRRRARVRESREHEAPLNVVRYSKFCSTRRCAAGGRPQRAGRGLPLLTCTGRAKSHKGRRPRSPTLLQPVLKDAASPFEGSGPAQPGRPRSGISSTGRRGAREPATSSTIRASGIFNVGPGGRRASRGRRTRPQCHPRCAARRPPIARAARQVGRDRVHRVPAAAGGEYRATPADTRRCARPERAALPFRRRRRRPLRRGASPRAKLRP